MAMPWSRAKQVARALRGDGDFPAGYTGSRTVAELTALFDSCFRIQREACKASGRHIPMVVENVRGAIPWVGRSRWNFGSFHLWGDVPALMPMRGGIKGGGGTWFGNYAAGIKQGGDWFNASQPSISRMSSSKSEARRRAQALIAKIPLPLSRHIAATFKPREFDRKSA
jgi:hypothetical protein